MILAALTALGCGGPPPEGGEPLPPTPSCTREPCVRVLASASAVDVAAPGSTFGYALAATSSHVVVGAPDYYADAIYPRVLSLALPDLSVDASWIGKAYDMSGQAIVAADTDGDGVEEVAFSRPNYEPPGVANGTVIHLVDPSIAGVCDLEADAAECTLLTIWGSPDNGDGEMAIGSTLTFAEGGRQLWFDGIRPSGYSDHAVYAYDTSDRGTVTVADARKVITGPTLGAPRAWDGTGDGTDDLVLWDNSDVVWFEGPWRSGTSDDRDGIWTRPGPAEEAVDFGLGTTPVGDVTGDGLVDLALPARLLNGGAGTVFLAPGASPTPAFGAATDLPITVAGTAPEMGMGYAIAGGDLDGDGAQDLVVSASGVWGWSDPGVVLVYRGPVAPGDYTPDDADARVYGERAGELFARSLATIDTDHDGRDDLVAGAPAALGGGAVYLVTGAALFP